MLQKLSRPASLLASPERGYYGHPSRHLAGQPIVTGWVYQWVAELGFARGSWVVPEDVRRGRPTKNHNVLAADQVRELVRWLSDRGKPPLFVFDAGYDAVGLQRKLDSFA